MTATEEAIRASKRDGTWEGMRHVHRCPCGRAYTATEWAALPYVGEQVIPADEYGPEERIELRDCACGSTRAVEVT